MECLYYIEREHETVETGDRLEAERIVAEWRKRGYQVNMIAVDTTDGTVQLADTPMIAVAASHPKTCTNT